MTTLTVTADHDYHLEDVTGTDAIVFNAPSGAWAVFSAGQFGTQISNTVHVTGGATQSDVHVYMSTAGTFSAAGWTFSNWGLGVVLIGGSDGADTITGSSGQNWLIGGGGADQLIGGNSIDSFVYHSPSDIAPGETVDGGDSLDGLIVGAGGDYDFSAVDLISVETFSFFSANPATATLRQDQIGPGGIMTVYGSNVESDLIVRGFAIDLSGVAFQYWNPTADTIAIRGSSAFGNTLIGSSQNESIGGAPGSRDFMQGRGGNDIYFIDHTGDFVDESALGSIGFDIVYASISFSLADALQASGAIEELVLIGTGDINATGNAIGDVLIGNDGNNIMNGGGASDALRGRGGSDTLNGGAANDTLTGGADSDRFRFNSALNAALNVDHIVDFAHPADTIVLSHTVFSEIAIGALSAAAFRVGTAATDASDRLIYDQPTGRLWYDADGSGAQAKVLFAILDNHAGLNFTDFMVVA